ncbi:UDP-N-acetylglucosamine--LPS N-acetylglucosamine transferase [Chloroflexia bacterium SDU3-3]|nr:UDP-N-acetylglucosamine--LPS N-acetylglucosamine transferase [Chloroflexia bacterium SDU3-3]
MPGILILYTSLGTGHRTAALALAEALAQCAPETTVVTEDALDYCSGVVKKALNTAYLQSSERGPKLYKAAYEASDSADFDEALGLNRLISILGGPLLRDMDAMIDAMQPDAIICTMQLPLQLMAHRKQQGALHCPLYVVVTDFVAHSTWYAPEADGYFVPSALTRDMMCRRGARAEQIAVTGIPVPLTIAEEKTMSAMRERHGLPTEGAVVSLFGGGIEAERIRLIVDEIARIETPATLAVVSGRNEQLAEAIADVPSGPHVRLLKLGAIDYVDDLVAASDLVITKAGGLIVSEILGRGTPMIIIDPLPGQEEWNADMVAACGAGIQLRMAEMVPPATAQLLGNLDQLMAMRRQAQSTGRPRAALDIASAICAQLATPAS